MSTPRSQGTLTDRRSNAGTPKHVALPRKLANRIKAQAVFEDITANDLVARIATAYLDSKEARAARNE